MNYVGAIWNGCPTRYGSEVAPGLLSYRGWGDGRPLGHFFDGRPLGHFFDGRPLGHFFKQNHTCLIEIEVCLIRLSARH